MKKGKASGARASLVKFGGGNARLLLQETDRGYESLRRTVTAMKQGKSYVKAGVLGNGAKAQRPGEPIDNVGLAVVHEFGSAKAGIPERSFIRAGFDKNRAQYAGMLRKLVPQVYEGRRTVEQILGLVGLKMVADIQAYVRQGSNLAPNSPETLERKLAKGRAGMGKKQGPVAMPRPLIDTGRLLNSLSSEVVVVQALKAVKK